MKREIEDGMGFNGLIPTKQERYIEKLEAENKRLREALKFYVTSDENSLILRGVIAKETVS